MKTKVSPRPLATSLSKKPVNEAGVIAGMQRDLARLRSDKMQEARRASRAGTSYRSLRSFCRLGISGL
jgi:hypothetical protein